VDGKQAISQNVSDFELLYMNDDWSPERPTSFVGIMLSGNISLAPYAPTVGSSRRLALEEMSSKILQIGLAACQDVVPTFWIDYWSSEDFSTSDVSEPNSSAWYGRPLQQHHNQHAVSQHLVSTMKPQISSTQPPDF
jgi:hypothetical protein